MTQCKGTGRRFKGSMKSQFNPATCPVCKSPSDHLGMAGVTSAMAVGMKIVVPAHADPRP